MTVGERQWDRMSFDPQNNLIIVVALLALAPVLDHSSDKFAFSRHRICRGLVA